VTISSSDDDCMIVSGGSEAESEPEDPTNSGLHTNDVFNIPDAQGQVLINVGHPKNEPDIFLAPQVCISQVQLDIVFKYLYVGGSCHQTSSNRWHPVPV
jgi:hypothetical protein